MKNDKYAYPAHIDSVGGLSRRELFAAMAMQDSARTSIITVKLQTYRTMPWR